MRKKLDTRFPASRIKKIMQTDEDVGKIALAVPLLVSKALELFLQDLCDRSYDVTLKRGAKTMSSAHLKQCVHNFSVFDFLKEIVSRVPDVCYDVGNEDRSFKRRKAVDDEGNATDEESKRSNRWQETVHNSRGRGRGRGRGRRRVSHGTEWDISHYNKCEDGSDTSPEHHDKLKKGENDFSRTEPKENDTSTSVPVRDFDLNLDLDENGFATATSVSALPTASTMTAHEMKQEEYNAWPPITYIDKMTIDPLQLALMDKRIDDEEEDYDNED